MNLNTKFFGIKLWVWIIIGLIVLYLFINNNENFANDTVSLENEQLDDNSVIKMQNDNSIKSKQKFKVFNFNTSWCGWSKRFQPEWDALTKMVDEPSSGEDEQIRQVLRDNVSFLDIKCDNNENIDLCNKYDIPGYPHVIIENINNGDKFVYNNERTSAEMYKFIVNNIYTYIQENN